MARNESDREDLLREATALVERAELGLRDFAEPIVIGFRRDGSASIYLGVEPVFQFNSQCQLRRAYVAGQLIKAEGGQLFSLRRERSESGITLLRREFSADETQSLLQECAGWLQRLEQAIAACDCEWKGHFPPDKPVLARILSWLQSFPWPLVVASRPNVG